MFRGTGYFGRHTASVFIPAIINMVMYFTPKSRLYFPLSLGIGIQNKLIDNYMGLTRHK